MRLLDRLFGCQGCVARDVAKQHLLAEITWLRGRTETLEAQLAELAAPGINHRLAPRPPKPAEALARRPIQVEQETFPGFEPDELSEALEIEG